MRELTLLHISYSLDMKPWNLSLCVCVCVYKGNVWVNFTLEQAMKA